MIRLQPTTRIGRKPEAGLLDLEHPGVRRFPREPISKRNALIADCQLKLEQRLVCIAKGKGPPVQAMVYLCGPASDQQILDFMLENPDAQQCAEGLGQLALDCGSRDNVSCIVIDVVDK